MNRTAKIAAFGAGAIGLVSAVSGTVVLAQEGGGGGSPAPTLPGGAFGQHADAYLDALAANLGIDRATLDAALKKTGTDMIDKAVADGTLTQEKADAIKKMIEEAANGSLGFGSFGSFGSFGPKGIGGESPRWSFGGGAIPSGREALPGGMLGPIGHLPDVATFLGIDEATLREELNSGKTFAQVAEAHGKTRQELADFLTAELDERIQEAVDGGMLTEEQAATFSEMLGEHIDAFLDGQIRMHRFSFSGPGGSGFRGGFGGGIFPGLPRGSTAPVPPQPE